MDFSAILLKYPPSEMSEMTVIKEIHKAVETAQHCLKKDKKGDSHLPYLIKAYDMLEEYFNVKGITPE
jgi:hypothetical protein